MRKREKEDGGVRNELSACFRVLLWGVYVRVVCVGVRVKSVSGGSGE
jgi:hypothetical protein